MIDLQRMLARFDRLYAKFLRAHPRVIDDTAVTEADFSRYNVVLFGDPGSNSWIEKVLPSLPLRWTRKELHMNGVRCAAAVDDENASARNSNAARPRRAVRVTIIFATCSLWLNSTVRSSLIRQACQFHHGPDGTVSI